LAENETIIDPFYMQQLLEYGISLGQGQQGVMDDEKIIKEAEARLSPHRLAMNIAHIYNVFL
jgi:hypothetical protein